MISLSIFLATTHIMSSLADLHPSWKTVVAWSWRTPLKKTGRFVVTGLVVFLEHDWIIFPLGMSSSQFTKSYFSDWWLNREPVLFFFVFWFGTSPQISLDDCFSIIIPWINARKCNDIFQGPTFQNRKVPTSQNRPFFWILEFLELLYHVRPYVAIPSGKLLHGYGKSHFVVAKSTISMVIFHCYFDITRGYKDGP